MLKNCNATVVRFDAINIIFVKNNLFKQLLFRYEKNKK